MATLTDDFTGGYDAGVWDEFEQVPAGTTITEANNQIEIDWVSGANTPAGLVTKITYDLSEPGDVELDFIVVDRGMMLHISANKAALSGQNPYDLNDWYRIGNESGTYVAQKKVGAGSPSTIGAGAESGAQVYKMDFPSTGDDVRFIVGGVENHSDATYALGTRDMYIHLYGYVRSGDTDADFDTFSATYTAAAGGTILPFMMNY